MLIDLHTHTNVSDGLDSPEDLVSQAKSAGLSVIAITDHDTVIGWERLRPPTKQGRLTVVPGAEISCQTSSGMSVHMLGYLFNPNDAPLTEMMSLTRDDRL